ncbi:MAG TPA: class I SAM-dependent methyltransferase [Solirubrobacter sp.]|nr:class I SAM-dependent methyltransferase [Solirubrobacter sp.]
MNLDALWHDLECGDYRDDLPYWRALAAETGGPVLDIGAGTGRVTVDLAGAGFDVVALDIEPALLAALSHRAAVETVVADACAFELGRRFGLIVAPMQTLQMLADRPAFLRRALAHLRPGGLLAAAIADAMDCFDDDHPVPPPPQVLDIGDVRYASQLLAVIEESGRAALHRRRTITGREPERVVDHLVRLTPDQLTAEAAALGFLPEPPRRIPESDRYLGATIVVLRAP